LSYHCQIKLVVTLNIQIQNQILSVNPGQAATFDPNLLTDVWVIVEVARVTLPSVWFS
jgi:hypothetical protein